MDHERSLVPERILDSLVCQKCFSYLTVLPILVTLNGQQMCGRCIAKKYPKNSKPFCLLDETNAFDGVYNIPVALLGYVSYRSLFPCINKVEGCKKWFKLEAIEKHEETCVYTKIQCPLCGFCGVGTQIINHFKHYHCKYHKAEALVTLNARNSFNDTVLYNNSNNMFSDVLLFVKIAFEVDNRNISLHISCLSNNGRICTTGIARLLCRVKSANSEFTQLEVLSEKLDISKGRKYAIAIQTEDFHFVESHSMDCMFKLLVLSR